MLEAAIRKGELSGWVRDGVEITTRVTPGARREALEADGNALRIWVTVTPEGGKANAAVQGLMGRFLGVAKSRLTLIRGKTSRTKVWRLD